MPADESVKRPPQVVCDMQKLPHVKDRNITPGLQHLCLNPRPIEPSAPAAPPERDYNDLRGRTTNDPATGRNAAIEEAERIVDRMTCYGCKRDMKMVSGRHHLAPIDDDHICSNHYCGAPCIGQGRDIVAALVAEGWGKK